MRDVVIRVVLANKFLYFHFSCHIKWSQHTEWNGRKCIIPMQINGVDINGGHIIFICIYRKQKNDNHSSKRHDQHTYPVETRKFIWNFKVNNFSFNHTISYRSIAPYRPSKNRIPCKELLFIKQDSLFENFTLSFKCKNNPAILCGRFAKSFFAFPFDLTAAALRWLVLTNLHKFGIRSIFFLNVDFLSSLASQNRTDHSNLFVSYLSLHVQRS